MASDKNSINLSSVNKDKSSSKTKKSTALKNPLKKQKGPARDTEGKFTSGSGRLKQLNFNWKRALPLVAVVAIAGGVMVFRGSASSHTGFVVNQFVASSSTRATIVQEDGRTSKRNANVVSLANTSSSTNARAVYTNDVPSGQYRACLWGIAQRGNPRGTLTLAEGSNTLGTINYSATNTADYEDISCTTINHHTSQGRSSPMRATVTNTSANTTLRVSSVLLIYEGAASSTPAPRPPAGSSDCALPRYPTDDCTGARLGSSPRVHQGNFEARTAGQVVENMRITGQLRVRAPGVVIRNVEVWGQVGNWWDGTARHSFTIEDSTVGRNNQPCFFGSAISASNFTARRVRVLPSFVDGFNIADSNVLIEDSYATVCQSTGPTWQHSDGVQVLGNNNSPTNIRVRHNVFDLRQVTEIVYATCPIFMPTDQSPNLRVAEISDNIVAGGEDGLCLYNPGPGNFERVTGNKVVNNTYFRTPAAVNCSNIGVWRDNAVVDYNFTTGTITRQVRTLDNC